MTTRIASAEIQTFMQAWETLALVAYLDGGGVPTIGWGHTKGVMLGDICTRQQAVDWFADEMYEYADELHRFMTRDPTQQQFDALLSLGHNAGIGGSTGIGRAGIMRLFNAGHDDECADRFLAWSKDNGVVVRGLLKRRKAEREIYLYSDYSGRP